MASGARCTVLVQYKVVFFSSPACSRSLESLGPLPLRSPDVAARKKMARERKVLIAAIETKFLHLRPRPPRLLQGGAKEGGGGGREGGRMAFPCPVALAWQSAPASQEEMGSLYYTHTHKSGLTLLGPFSRSPSCLCQNPFSRCPSESADQKGIRKWDKWRSCSPLKDATLFQLQPCVERAK